MKKNIITILLLLISTISLNAQVYGVKELYINYGTYLYEINPNNIIILNSYVIKQNIIEPKFEKIEQQYERMISDQKEQNRIFYDKLSDINSAISVLNANINALNKNYTNIQEQTNGTFDSNVTLNNQEIINNNTLAQFEHY